MYQNADESTLCPDDYLAREWTLFQSVDSGACACAFTCWEADRPVVVVGRNSRLSDHVIPDACEADAVDVVRRCSGGGAVVLGPGCLNYAVAVSLVSSPQLAEVAASFRSLLGRLVTALEVPGLAIDGETDLVLEGRKVSGNAQRRGHQALIHHGTLLYDFDAALATRYLKEPARRPAYRATRCHAEFMGNLPLHPATLRARLDTAWLPLVPPASRIVGVPPSHMHNGADVR
jgi:lipoate---protein ligase